MQVLEYLKELDIKPAKRLSQLTDKLIVDLGKERADEIISAINERGRAERIGTKPDDEAFYRIKHQDLNVSLAVSGGFDGDIIRRILEWLDDSTVSFGKRVLDIGCENGLMTIYLAINHPESQFLGIDRSPEAIVCAEALKERFNICNVRFEVMNANDIKASETERFDTVICSRNIHENLEYFTPDRMELFRIQAEAYEDHLRDYAGSTNGILNDGGEFITIERNDIPAFNLGWQLALNELGIAPAELGEIHASYLGQGACFQVAIMKKGNPMGRKELLTTFLDFCLNDPSRSDLQGSVQGCMLLERIAVGLIEGIDLYNAHDIRAARLAVWQCTGDMVMMERHSLGNSIHDYVLLPVSRTEDALQVIRNDARNYRNGGFRGEDLKKVLANQGLI